MSRSVILVVGILCYVSSAVTVGQSFTYKDDCVINVDNATILIPESANQTLPTGATVTAKDTVAVRDESGNCVGYAVGLSDSTGVAIAAAGPSSLEEATSGYESGQELSFEVYDVSKATIQSLGRQVGYASCDTIAVPTCRDDGKYADGAAFVIDALQRPPYTRVIAGADDQATDAGWRMLSLPAADVSRAGLEDDAHFDATTAPIVYRFTDDQWVAQTDATDLLPRGRGFLLYFFDTGNFDVDAEGTTLDVGPGPETPNADTKVDSLTQDREWHLVGNPYGVAFDLGALAEGDLPGAGFQATVQIWDPAIDEYEQIVQGDEGDDISAWQGFFIQRSSLGAGQTHLAFSTSGRQTGKGPLIGSSTTDKRGQVWKRGRATKTSQYTEIELHLVATSPDGQPVGTARTTYRMDPRASTGYDAYEAEDFPPPGGENFVSASLPIMKNETLVHRALGAAPPPRDRGAVHRSVPLEVRSRNVSGTAVISWPDSSTKHVPDDWRIRLLDTKADSTIDLRPSNYTFDLVDGDSLRRPGSARFRLQLHRNARPLELVQFTGRPSNDAVQLQWTPAGRPDDVQFRVERQIQNLPNAPNPGETDWTHIGTVQKRAMMSKPRHFRFEDTDVSYQPDTLRYRLLRLDADGSKHYSTPITVGRHRPGRVHLRKPFPNPTDSRATVQYTIPKREDAPDRATLTLYDLMGRRVRTYRVDATPGRHKREIDVANISSGVYFLQLRTKTSIKTHKLMVVQ